MHSPLHNRVPSQIEPEFGKPLRIAVANDGIRTHDLLITNQLHYHCATLAFLPPLRAGSGTRESYASPRHKAPAAHRQDPDFSPPASIHPPSHVFARAARSSARSSKTHSCVSPPGCRTSSDSSATSSGTLPTRKILLIEDDRKAAKAAAEGSEAERFTVDGWAMALNDGVRPRMTSTILSSST